MEEQLQGSLHTKRALILGNQRPQVIVLIIPSSSDVTAADFEPLLETMNSTVPTQSRLLSEHMRILDPHAEFYLSPKGDVVRSKTEEMFQEVVDRLCRQTGREMQ